MKCLTPVECSKWLQERSIIESPYGNKKFPVKLQFEPPRDSRTQVWFTRKLLNISGGFSGALLHFIDWKRTPDDEMALLGTLRHSHNEQRSLIDAPGHLFGSTEVGEVMGICQQAETFDWSVYLYLASGAATFFFWEGDLIDFWSKESEAIKEVRELVKECELRVTYKEGRYLTLFDK